MDNLKRKFVSADPKSFINFDETLESGISMNGSQFDMYILLNYTKYKVSVVIYILINSSNIDHSVGHILLFSYQYVRVFATSQRERSSLVNVYNRVLALSEYILPPNDVLIKFMLQINLSIQLRSFWNSYHSLGN